MMDTKNDSDTDTDEERCIIEQAGCALPLPHSKHVRVEECTPQQPLEVTMSAAGRLRRSAAVEAGPLIARMLDMDMDYGSNSNYAPSLSISAQSRSTASDNIRSGVHALAAHQG